MTLRFNANTALSFLLDNENDLPSDDEISDDNLLDVDETGAIEESDTSVIDGNDSFDIIEDESPQYAELQSVSNLPSSNAFEALSNFNNPSFKTERDNNFPRSNTFTLYTDNNNFHSEITNSNHSEEISYVSRDKKIIWKSNPDFFNNRITSNMPTLSSHLNNCKKITDFFDYIIDSVMIKK